MRFIGRYFKWFIDHINHSLFYQKILQVDDPFNRLRTDWLESVYSHLSTISTVFQDWFNDVWIDSWLLILSCYSIIDFSQPYLFFKFMFLIQKRVFAWNWFLFESYCLKFITIKSKKDRQNCILLLKNNFMRRTLFCMRNMNLKKRYGCKKSIIE